MNKKEMEKLRKITRQIRINTLRMLYEAGTGHLGSAMSTLELVTALYFGGVLKYNSKKPDWEDRDYFLLSNGHACPSFYAVLAHAGYFPLSKLKNSLFKLGTGLEGHPVRGSLAGIEISSGSLGHGLSVGLGIALGVRSKKKNNKVVVMMSDGEQQEGSVWEAAMAANHYQTGNLIAVIDRNGIQIAGDTEKNIKLEPLDKKYQSFGWQVIKINGHDFSQIIPAFKQAFANKKPAKPTVIIAKTIPANGVFSLEGREDTHHPHLTEEIYKKTLEKLNKRDTN